MVAVDDAEVQADEAQDEFAGNVVSTSDCHTTLLPYTLVNVFHVYVAEHFQRVRPPNVLLTTCYKPSGIMYKFLAEMLEVLPCATYYKRQVHPCGNSTAFSKPMVATR